MDNDDAYEPVQVELLGSVPGDPQYNCVHIGIGTACSSAVTETGDVYMWGWGMESPVPLLIHGLRGNTFQQVDCGSNGLIACLSALTTETFAWSFEEEEEEGDEQPEEKLLVNTYLRGKRLCSLSAGQAHYGGVTEGGKLIMWGSNEAFCLGLGLDSDVKHTKIPRELSLKWFVVDVKCGIEHCVALTREGQVRVH